jgi:3-oxoacyl-(acyl-carrier-protein) synthase
VVGFAASQDAHRITEPEPSGHSYGMAITNALREAKLSPAEVDVLIPHGLGITAFDRAELNGMKKAFGDDLQRVACSPIKAQIGNLAAGCGVDAAAAVLSVESGRVPGAINTRKAIGNVSLNVRAQVREARVNVALSSVYSLGGQNAALVFRKV